MEIETVNTYLRIEITTDDETKWVFQTYKGGNMTTYWAESEDGVRLGSEDVFHAYDVTDGERVQLMMERVREAYAEMEED